MEEAVAAALELAIENPVDWLAMDEYAESENPDTVADPGWLDNGDVELPAPKLGTPGTEGCLSSGCFIEKEVATLAIVDPCVGIPPKAFVPACEVCCC